MVRIERPSDGDILLVSLQGLRMPSDARVHPANAGQRMSNEFVLWTEGVHTYMKNILEKSKSLAVSANSAGCQPDVVLGPGDANTTRVKAVKTDLEVPLVHGEGLMQHACVAVNVTYAAEGIGDLQIPRTIFADEDFQ